MYARSKISIYMMMLMGILLAACAPAVPKTVIATVEVVKEVQAPAATEAPAVIEAPAATEAPAIAEARPAFGTAVPQPPPHDAAGRARLIIKDAQVKLLVADTDVAIDRTTQMVSDMGGYIISSRLWYKEAGDKNYKFATLTLGVPVDRFEQALRRLRELAIRVLDENASGQDVTDEYVDQESRLKNLQATRDRIREFLTQAKTVEEALKVNEQLADVEAEIEKVQGRMNYLFDRAAFSTITIDIEPEIILPTPTPTYTPSPTPTRTVTPTPTPWSAATTFRDASTSLRDLSVVTAQAAIWILVLIVPMLIPPALIVLLIWYLVRGRRKSHPKKVQQPEQTPAETS